MIQTVKDLCIGAVIGAANIIPGVSGGTMALVMGVYERLLGIISSISIGSVKAFAGVFKFNDEGRRRFVEEFQSLEGFFLIKLAIGAVLAIVLLASIMTFLLEHYHDPTYGFFFGLVLLSAVYPYKLIGKKSLVVLIMAVIGCIAVVAISGGVSKDDLIEKYQLKQQIKAERAGQSLKPADAPSPLTDDGPHYPYMFLMGAVAITAMVLPGVSGSFLLLLMGGYFDILKAIAVRDLALLSVFALGCVAGLLVSTRIINFLLHRWHDATMSFLLGLVIGSLWLIWPFKNTMQLGGETVYLDNTFPSTLGGDAFMTLLTMLAGAATVLVFLVVEWRQQAATSSEK